MITPTANPTAPRTMPNVASGPFSLARKRAINCTAPVIPSDAARISASRTRDLTGATNM